MKGMNLNIPSVYLVLIRERKVLLQERKNTGFCDGQYSFVAGKVEHGESYANAIIRESLEEIGIVISPGDLQFLHIMHRNPKDSGRMERVDVFFTADSWQGAWGNRIPDKCSDLDWFGIDDLPDNTIPYIREALSCIRENRPYSEFGWIS